MDTSLPTGAEASHADDDAWEVAGRRFRSRLVVGTGRYKSLEETAAAAPAPLPATAIAPPAPATRQD